MAKQFCPAYSKVIAPQPQEQNYSVQGENTDYLSSNLPRKTAIYKLWNAIRSKLEKPKKQPQEESLHKYYADYTIFQEFPSLY